MKRLHHGRIIELPDTWWQEAGMAGFVPSGQEYPSDTRNCQGKQVFSVRIEEVAPVCRDPGIGIFNDDKETGCTARQRVLYILECFRSGKKVEPVEVVKLPEGNAHKYKLVHGAHRLYCSLMAGFTSVPAIEGFDWDSF